MRSAWLAPLALLAACGHDEVAPAPPGAGVPEAAAPAVPQNPWGFTTWHQDFPFPVHRSPPAPTPWYGHSKRQALERLADRLQGNSTREAWLMAKEFFRHAPEEAVPLLIEQMDRAMQSKHLADLVENTVEAFAVMTHLRRPEIGQALLRALQHPKESVQAKAMGALVPAGDAAAVRKARDFLEGMPPRAVGDWLRAARAHLPDEVEAIYGEFLRSERWARLFGVVVEETAKLPSDGAARVLEPLWNDSRGSLRATIACVLHAAGDLRGTRFLQEILRKGDAAARANVLKAVRAGSLEHLLDDVLKLSVDEDLAVRQAVILVIADLPGENIDRVLETLAMDAATEVRQPALAALRSRGKREPLDRLVERVRTATGTTLVAALADLSTVGDGDAIPAMVERMRASPPREARKFLQAIGRSGSLPAFDALRAVLLAPESEIDHKGEDTSWTYAGILLPNLRASQERVLELAQELPRSDYRRRAIVLHALGNLAALAEDRGFAQRTFDLERAWLRDPSELPQMRLLALEYLRRDLTLADLEAVKELAAKEEGPMHRALTDFLFEFF